MDNIDINIKAIVQGLDSVRYLVREIEKLPGAGDGIKGLSAQFANVKKDIEATVKELDKAGNELKALGTDTQRIMQQASTATNKVPTAVKSVGTASKATNRELADLSKSVSAIGNAFQQAIQGDALGALSSLSTALRTSIDFNLLKNDAVKATTTVSTAFAGSEKAVSKFSSVLGTAAKSADGALSGALFRDFGIKAEQALLNPEIALQKFVSGLAVIPDAAERATAVANIFGASTAALLPTLEGMVAAEIAASAAAAAYALAQTTAATATADLAAVEATASATAAEIATARAAAVAATEALAVAETNLAAATTETVVVQETAAVASISLSAAMSLAGAAILGVLGIAAAVIGIGFAIGNSFADAGSKLHDMAEETGLTAEELSVLKLAADGAGSNLDKVAGSFTKYLRNINEAAGGNKEASRTFKQLGIDAVAGNKSSANALEQLFVAISKLPPGAQQVNAAMKAAGKSGADLIPVINQAGGSFEKFKQRAEELGVVISTDAANAADQFGDNMTELGSVLTGVRNEIGAALLPTLIELSNSLLQFATENRAALTDLANAIAVGFKIALGVFYAFGGTVAFVSNLLYSLITILYGVVTATYAVVTAMIQAGKATIQFLSGDVAGAVQTVKNGVNDAKNAVNDLTEALRRASTIISQPTFTSLFGLLNGGDGSTPKTNAIPKPKPTGSFSGGGGGKSKKPKVDPEIKAYQDALLDYRKAQIATEAALIQDGLKHEQEILKANFDQNLDSYEVYYKALASIQKRNFQAQIDEQEKLLAIEQEQLGKAKKGSERLKAETEILKISEKIVELKHAQSLVDQFIGVEVAKQARAYKDMITDIETQLLDLEGRTVDSSDKAIEKTFREALEKAQARLDGGDARGQEDIDRINRLKSLLSAQARFNELQERSNILVSAREQLETSLNNQVATGTISREAANQKLAEYEQAQIDTLNDLVAGMQKYADKVADPKLQQAVEAIRLQLQGWKIDGTARDVDAIKTKIDEVANAFDTAQVRRDTAVKNGQLTQQEADVQRDAAILSYSFQLDELLNKLEAIAVATGNTSLQQYVDKARAGIGQLQEDGDELGTQINQQILGSFSDLFTSIADGTATAGEAFADFGRSVLSILTQVLLKIILTKIAMAALGGAGGGQGGVGGFLSSLLGGDKAVGSGKARGGVVGKDGRPDSVLTPTVPGEFVVNAQDTAANLALLENINAGINPNRALNAGANVSPAATMQGAMANQNLQVVNVLPNDLLDNYVNSGSGTQTFLNMIENNATAINGRLKQANG